MKKTLIRPIESAVKALSSFLIMATAAFVYVGCAEDVVSDTVNGSQTASDDNAIAFSVKADDGNASVSTRTAPGTITLTGDGTAESLRELGAGVFAAHTGLHTYVNSNVSPGFMYNEKVTYNAGENVWEYAPVKYWPNGVDGSSEYVSFFAYAPYVAEPGKASNKYNTCITDFSLSNEQGDPWLVYQLGGERDDFFDKQVDLLYCVRLDEKKISDFRRVPLQMSHALAGIGDKVTIGVSNELSNKINTLANAVSGRKVEMTVEGIVLNYALTKKARLVLNNADSPNWQPITSESTIVHRLVEVNPDSPVKIAEMTAGAPGGPSITPYTLSDIGVFYIPLNIDNSPQKVFVTVKYKVTVTDVNPTAAVSTFVGESGAELLLNGQTAGINQNLNVLLSGSTPISSSEEGSVSNGLLILDITPVTYDGNPQAPVVIVTDMEGRVLREGDHYTLAYADNTNAGNSARVTATGVNDYQGMKAVKTFIINKAIGSVYYDNVNIAKTMGEPAFTNLLHNTGDGTLTFNSTNESVATVDENSGLVTLVAPGNTTIMVTVADGQNYTYPVKTASYGLTVSPAAP